MSDTIACIEPFGVLGRGLFLFLFADEFETNLAFGKKKEVVPVDGISNMMKKNKNLV